MILLHRESDRESMTKVAHSLLCSIWRVARPTHLYRADWSETVSLVVGEVRNALFLPISVCIARTKWGMAPRCGGTEVTACHGTSCYAASRSGKQSGGCRSILSTAGFTLMWNDARSPASFGPITLVNLSTVVLKSFACICCNSTAIVMSNNPLSHS
jgi:hypothetical protein